MKIGCTYRGIEQSIARYAHNVEVAGLSPASPTIATMIERIDIFDCLKNGISTIVDIVCTAIARSVMDRAGF